MLVPKTAKGVLNSSTDNRNQTKLSLWSGWVSPQVELIDDATHRMHEVFFLRHEYPNKTSSRFVNCACLAVHCAS